jgi:hypothetical protein
MMGSDAIPSEAGPPMNDVTRILSAIEEGDAQAAEQLLPLVYDELRKLPACQAAIPRSTGDRQTSYVEDMKMNRALAVLAIAVIPCVTGCRDQANQIPPNSFRATVKNLVEGSDLLVKHVIIEAPGKRVVKVTEKGRRSAATIEPAQDTDLMLAEVTFVAALVKNSESGNMIKWLIQIKGQGVTVGGPSSFPVEAESLADFIQLEFAQEFHPLGQDIVIGKFQGESIVLSVK